MKYYQETSHPNSIVRVDEPRITRLGLFGQEVKVHAAFLDGIAPGQDIWWIEEYLSGYCHEIPEELWKSRKPFDAEVDRKKEASRNSMSQLQAAPTTLATGSGAL